MTSPAWRIVPAEWLQKIVGFWAGNDKPESPDFDALAVEVCKLFFGSAHVPTLGDHVCMSAALREVFERAP